MINGLKKGKQMKPDSEETTEIQIARIMAEISVLTKNSTNDKEACLPDVNKLLLKLTALGCDAGMRIPCGHVTMPDDCTQLLQVTRINPMQMIVDPYDCAIYRIVRSVDQEEKRFIGIGLKERKDEKEKP
jgi:hypothetical protein